MAGGAHELALGAVSRARQAILSDAAETNFAVGSRAFRPYVYKVPDGAGTPLESALRFADSRVVVARPLLAEDIADEALGAFCGFRAGQGGVSGPGEQETVYGTWSPEPAGPGVPAGPGGCAPSAPASSAGAFCESTRPSLSGASMRAPGGGSR